MILQILVIEPDKYTADILCSQIRNSKLATSALCFSNSLNALKFLEKQSDAENLYLIFINCDDALTANHFTKVILQQATRELVQIILMGSPSKAFIQESSGWAGHPIACLSKPVSAEMIDKTGLELIRRLLASSQLC